MVKTELKMDIIWVRLIILKFCTINDYVTDNIVLIWQWVDDMIVDDVNILHVKRITQWIIGIYVYKIRCQSKSIFREKSRQMLILQIRTAE
jgi:hypothetical protein